MYIQRVSIIFLALCLAVNLFAQNGEMTVLRSPAYYQVDSILKVLDNVIANKEEYQHNRAVYADDLYRMANTMTGAERVAQLKKCYEDYSHFNGNKALGILARIEEMEEYSHDKNLRVWVADSRAYIFSVMGMFHRSYDIFNKLDIKGCDTDTRRHHYDVMYSVLNWAESSFLSGFSLTPEEEKLHKECNDSVLHTATDPLGKAFAQASALKTKKLYDEAVDVMLDILPQTNGQERTYCYAVIGDCLLEKGDTVSSMYSIALTSISDIKAGTTEYMALPILVKILFRQGDVERAYYYLQCCFDDAYRYPAHFLISQTSELFPLVNKAYQNQKSISMRNERLVDIFIGFFVVLVVIVIILGIWLRKRSKMNEELRALNRELMRQSRITTDYE